MPKRGPCGTEPVPSQQNDQLLLLTSKANLRGRWLKPPELGHHKGDLPQERSAGSRLRWRTGRRRQAFTAGGTVPPSLATTRATVLKGALPAARCFDPASAAGASSCSVRRRPSERSDHEDHHARRHLAVWPSAATKCPVRRRQAQVVPRTGCPGLAAQELPCAEALCRWLGTSVRYHGDEGKPPLPATLTV